MSFILDALKKSEAERQRQTGPTLLELRVTHPRRRYPIWAAIIGGLLAVNAIVLLFVALHRPAAQSGTANVATPAPQAAPVTAPGAAAPSARSPSVSAATGAQPPWAGTAPAAAVSQSATASAAQVTAATSVPPLAGTEGNAAAANLAPTRNPADDEPAVAGAQGPLSRADYATLPTASSLGDDLPALQLDMLVSSSRPADRYALINMHQVHEGDVLPEGVRVLAITPDGVAMEYHGQDFLLPRAAAPPPAQ